MTVGVEEHQAGLRAGDAELNPALLVTEGLVGENDESEFLGVEVERGILIADGNRCEFDGFDHGRSMLEKRCSRNVVFTAMVVNTTEEGDRSQESGVRITPWVMAVLLFVVNFYICRELFHLEYSRHMG